MMWTCPDCGETNEDHFASCWKCENAPEAEPGLPPLPPQRTRNLGEVVRFTVYGLVLGLVIGTLLAVSKWGPAAAVLLLGASIGAVPGAIIGAAVGLIRWAFFPYLPDESRQE
jgi:hypothetical protein